MSARGAGFVSTLGGLLILFAACTPPAPESPSTVDPTEEVAVFLEEYLAAIDARDATSLADAYVTDDRFAWIEDGAVRYRNGEDILAGLAAFPSESSVRTELSDLTVVPLGVSGAHAWATFTTTVGEGAGSFSFGGAISFVLEKVDGSWRLVGGHTSSPSDR